MVTVYIWNMTSVLHVGHAALKIAGSGGRAIYVSWWPVNPEGRISSRIPTFTTIAAGIGGVQASPHLNLVEDVNGEGKMPDYQVQVHGLDDSRMRDAWRLWLNSHQYLVWNSSCATTVSGILRAGGGDMYASWPGWLVWTPNEVGRYAQAINLGFNKMQAMQSRA